MEAEIRPSKNGDAVGISRVLAETWLSTYPNEELGITRDMIYPRHYRPDGSLKPEKVAITAANIASKRPGYESFVAVDDGNIVGVSSAEVAGGKRKLRVLYVLPEFQGRGLGNRLFDSVMAWHGDNDIFLKVATYNHRAIRFYVERGFVPLGPVQPEDEMRFDNGMLLPEIEMVRFASPEGV